MDKIFVQNDDVLPSEGFIRTYKLPIDKPTKLVIVPATQTYPQTGWATMFIASTAASTYILYLNPDLGFVRYDEVPQTHKVGEINRPRTQAFLVPKTGTFKASDLKLSMYYQAFIYDPYQVAIKTKKETTYTVLDFKLPGMPTTISRNYTCDMVSPTAKVVAAKTLPISQIVPLAEYFTFSGVYNRICIKNVDNGLTLRYVPTTSVANKTYSDDQLPIFEVGGLLVDMYNKKVSGPQGWDLSYPGTMLGRATVLDRSCNKNDNIECVLLKGTEGDIVQIVCAMAGSKKLTVTAPTELIVIPSHARFSSIMESRNSKEVEFFLPVDNVLEGRLNITRYQYEINSDGTIGKLIRVIRIHKSMVTDCPCVHTFYKQPAYIAATEFGVSLRILPERPLNFETEYPISMATNYRNYSAMYLSSLKVADSGDLELEFYLSDMIGPTPITYFKVEGSILDKSTSKLINPSLATWKMVSTTTFKTGVTGFTKRHFKVGDFDVLNIHTGYPGYTDRFEGYVVFSSKNKQVPLNYLKFYPKEDVVDFFAYDRNLYTAFYTNKTLTMHAVKLQEPALQTSADSTKNQNIQFAFDSDCPEPIPDPDKPDDKSNGNRLWLIVMLVFILLIAGIVAWYFLVHKKGSNNMSDNSAYRLDNTETDPTFRSDATIGVMSVPESPNL